MHLDEAQVGQGTGAHLRPFGGLIDGLGCSLLEIAHEIGDEALCFADDHVVRLEFVC